MAKTQTVWGLDLGRCALKALKIRMSGDETVEVVAHDYIEHAKILSQPDADRVELISAALEKFLSRNDISKAQVIVAVPGQQTLARFTKLPPHSAKKLPDLVRFEADQQIPFDMDEVIWDYQTFQEEGAPDLEVGIFAMKRELLREHLLHFEQASIEPAAVQSSPLAIYNAARFDGMVGSETTILVDIGAENTDLIIATADTFWTRNVPIGGNHFTEALVKAFKLSFSKAESLKRSADTSKYARQIFQAMRPVFADLVQELQRSIGFYSSTHRESNVEKVVCFGDACKLPGLQKYLQQNLGLPVEKPDAFKCITFAGGAGGGDFKDHLLAFGVAYGLAIQGADRAKITCNLLPAEIAKQIVWRKKRPAFAAAAACLFLAGGLVSFRQSADMRALAADAEVRVPSVTTIEAADDLITNGPSSALPDRARAVAIRNAGEFFKNQLRKLSGKGGSERGQTEELTAMQKNKSMIPRILQVIHQSVPRPQGALGLARTPSEIVDAMAEAPPRDERSQVFIEKLVMQYEADVNAYEWESVVEVEEPINDPASELDAIKIEITCRSAHKDRTRFMAETFMAALRKNGRTAGTGFYFDRVFLFDGNRIETPGGSAAGHGEGMDPVTNESTANDWRYVLWIDAILEDYPEFDDSGDEPGGGD